MITGSVEQDLILAIEDSWNEDTGGVFVPDNPSQYQCAVTALVIQDFYGGRLVRGTVGNISHYWNELDDGTEVDLTRQQFGHRVRELTRDGYRQRSYVLYPYEGATTKERYLALKKRVLGRLDTPDYGVL